jgi:hypothetical protein
MKKQILILLIASMIAHPAFSTVWRVNNITGVNCNFTSITAAQSSASVLAGDTLYLEPSAGTYGDITFTKKLTVIGNGYFLSQNPQTQADFNTSQLGSITYNTGSSGSKIIGCQIARITINTSELLIERNYIINDDYNSISFSTNNISHFIIRNNYIVNSYNSYSTIYCIYSNYSGVNDLQIYNNYIYNATNRHAIYLTNGTSVDIHNNIINGNVNVNNTTFENNILISGTFTYNNGIVNNNICNSTQFSTVNGTNNQLNVTMSNVFEGATGNSTDGQWQLKVSSPADSAGVGGIDCGMFGGTFPYILSGLPGIPSIYQNDQTIDYQNQKINVTISVKSHN